MLPLKVPFDAIVFRSTKSQVVQNENTHGTLSNTQIAASKFVHAAGGPRHDDPTGQYPLLSASFRNENNDLEIPIASFLYLDHELGVKRITDVAQWLWVAGRPTPPRPLHYQRMISRQIIVTQRMDLHLIWKGDRIFIKPVPRFLLDHDFWEANLLCTPNCGCSKSPVSSQSQVQGKGKREPARTEECEQRQLYKCALGFLLSYAALISYESDYHIARENATRLLPDDVTWPQWVNFVHQLLAPDNQANVNERYLYGELRLSRLNWIYRLKRISIIRGYLYGYNQYSQFFRANFSNLFAAFAYVVVVLTAMQVGLATKELASDERFHRASYGFAVFTVLGPIVIAFLALAVFAFLFFENLVSTLKYREKRFAGLKRDEDGSRV